MSAVYVGGRDAGGWKAKFNAVKMGGSTAEDKHTVSEGFAWIFFFKPGSRVENSLPYPAFLFHNSYFIS